MKNQYIISLFVLLFANQFFAQGGDTGAAAAGAPITLPFNANGTTVGKTDNYNNIAVVGNVGFSSGLDWLYYFCATSNTVVTYTLTFTPDAVNGVWPSISVWEGGVPGVGTLQTDNAVVGDIETNMTGSFIVATGQCYYVMIDNWPTPNGFPYNLDLSLPPAAPVLTTQPACTNIGFESASFTGWTGGWGNTVTTNLPGSSTPIFFPSTYNTTTTQHAITSGAATDPIAGFPQVCPGLGNNSARLGTIDNFSPDFLYPNRGGSMIEQKFSVTASNALFTYYYAAVVQDALTPVYFTGVDGLDSLDAFGNPVPMPNWNNTGDSIVHHYPQEQPFFQVELFDNSGNPLACGNYLVVGGPGVPGFTLVPGTTDMYYKNWTPVFIDLTPYVGSNVTVKFTVADCSKGGHFAYCYIDAVCEPMVVNAPVSVCPSGSTTLTSSLTGSAYSWTDITAPGTVLGTAQTLSVSPTAATTNYQCVVTAASGCSTILDFTVNVYPVTTVTSTNATICNGASGTITATGLPVGGSYSWAPAGGLSAMTTALSPVSTTTYTCTYTDLNGCTATGTGTITVNPLPVAPTTAPISYCQNAVTVPLTATVSPAPAGNTLNWYTVPVGGVSSSTAPTPSSATVGSTTYYVSQTTALGCEGPRATLVVTINALPVVAVNSPTICPSTSATLTATGASTYIWDATPALNANPYIVSPAVTTSYTVEGTSALGCTGTATATVTVANVLLITVNSPTICVGGTAVLTGNGGTTYSWDEGASLAVSTANPYSVSPAITTTYTVTGTTGGCSGTATATVTVNPVPTTTAGSNGPICAGAALNLSAVASVVPGATYSWTGPNAFVSGSQNPTIAGATVVASGVYTVTVLANGCSSTSTINVVVNPIPTTIAASNSPICEGSALNLTATASAGATYTWTGPSAFTSVSQNPTIAAATIAATGAYTVTVAANGCSSTSTVNTIVNVIPTTTAGSNSPICEASTLNLTATASPGSTFSWVGPNAFVSGVQNPSIAGVILAATGAYTVTVAANGCSSTSIVNVIVNPIPVTVAGSNSPICQGSDLNLTATTSVGSTYSWTGPNAFSSALQNPTIIAATLPATGMYTVTVTANGCFSSSTVNVTVNAPVLPIFTVLPSLCEGTVPPILPIVSLNGITGSWLPNPVSTTIIGPTTYDFTPNAGQCALPTSMVITINPLPVVVTSPRDTCAPFTVDLTDPSVTAGTTAGVILTYWNDLACTVPLSTASAVGISGIYFIEATTIAGCVDVQPVVVDIHSAPLASFTPTPAIVSNLNAYSIMNNTSIGAVSYTWDFGDDQTSILTSPGHYFPDSDSGTYLITLVATSAFGCTDIAIATVKVNEELIFYVPNTFTPDKDSFNETFQPIFTSGFDPFDYRLLIFNRWGEVIFESHNTEIGWRGLYGVDGEQVQDDTYTWKIEFTVKSTNQRKMVVGHVNVLR